MRLIDDATPFEPAGTVVAIGMFDGVHRGHRRLLHALRDQGVQRGLPTAVVTFDPHPRAVLRPDAAPALLVTPARRIELLSLTGAVDHCLVLPFDRRRSEEPAHDFVERTLVGRLRMRALVVGENFRCGRGRAGDIGVLRTLGQRLGYTVHPVSLHTPAESAAEPPCSSTEMRRLIESGDIVRAAAGLARPHEMAGTVSTPSDRAGRVLEVTLPPGLCTPAADDYAGAVRNRRAQTAWVPALLQVRHHAEASRRTVRLVAADAIPATHGDELSLRFLQRASSWHAIVH